MPVGGAFCGQSWGPSVFYSETRSLVLSVKLFKLLREQNGYNFDFRIDYKFLSKEESIVRYGGLKSEFFENMTKETHHSSNNFDNKITTDTKNSEAYDTYEQEIASRINEWYGLKNNMTSYMTSTFDNSGRNYNNINNNNNYNNYRKSKPKLLKNGTVTIDEKYYLGDLIPGTYCSRIYSNCDKKLCRLQSPNYPGMYPRNLTCYYAVRQVSRLSKNEKTFFFAYFVCLNFFFTLSVVQPLIIIFFLSLPTSTTSSFSSHSSFETFFKN